MLADEDFEDSSPLKAVATASARMYPEFVHELQDESGINCDLRDQGTLKPASNPGQRNEIAELEPAPRGLYTGAIGYFGFNGESQFNIAIRTVVIENGVAHFHTGAGIVADSVPEQEYEETLRKEGVTSKMEESLYHEPAKV